MIRLFDILFSSIAILLFSPFMVPVYIVLKLTGQHQAFYVQQRIGKGGKEFGLYKFVTMVPGAEHLPGGYLTQKNDPRVLPIGKLLRKTKLNELPQLKNIFLGQMSFVGPRPLPWAHYDMYSPEVKNAIDAIPPGLTGIGSVVFRDEEHILDQISTNRTLFYRDVVAPYKGQLELWYSSNRTLYTYAMLILLTAWSLVRPRTIVWLRLFSGIPPVPPTLRTLLGVDKHYALSYSHEIESPAS